MKNALGIYIHIPFCSSKCYYCDFNSSPEKLDRVEEYFNSLLKEIDFYESEIRKCGINTVFIGGGTPTVVDSKYIGKLLEKLYMMNKDHSPIKEITIEGNPATFTADKVKDYIRVGINRFSMGVQSFNDRLLKKIGRSHTEKDVYDSVETLRAFGAKNINLDIMFGLPDQTYDDVLESIEKAIKLKVEHLSYYSLKLEEGTVLYDLDKRDYLNFPDEDTERKMYHDVKKILERYGYDHYEISNFSKKGYESVHNIGYWELKPYIGLGLSAASNIYKKRYSNVEDFDEYIRLIQKGVKPISNESIEEIDKKMEMAEYLILGLRLSRGISIKEFKKRFDTDIFELYENVISKYERLKIIEVDSEKIKLTDRGLDLSNQLFSELLP